VKAQCRIPPLCCAYRIGRAPRVGVVRATAAGSERQTARRFDSVEHSMNTGPDDPQGVTTALSTLTARVAMLERWMRQSQRRQATLIVLVVIALLMCAALLTTR
jgi:hypothetical protein